MQERIALRALALAAALAFPSLPVLANAASAGAAASSSKGEPAQFSESIGVSTPQKRIVGTSREHGPQGPAASDERLLSQVVAALVRDPAMKGADIDVSVEQGQVTLDGRAKDSAQAEHARQLAGNLAGSGNVTSTLSTSG